MCRRYCKETTVITRNPESQEILGKLGIPTELGTDTAWTFEPLGPEYARKALRDAGWDGKSTVLAVCPINPFWWPVKPSLAKWVAHSAFGAYKNSHYRTMYFHRSGADVDAAYEKYLTAIADGVRPYSKERNAFVVLVGMEMLDRDACERVSAKLGGCPVFSSDTYNMYELVEHSSRRGSHLVVAFPRHRHLHARRRAFGRRHHGRAHPQFDEGTPA